MEYILKGGNTTLTILDIIRRPVFYLKHNVSETGFCLRLQMRPTKFGSNDKRDSYSLSSYTSNNTDRGLL
jgi:hypothetical protein